MTNEEANYAMSNRLPIIQEENATSGEIEYECITGIMKRYTGQIVAELKSITGNSVTIADIRNIRIKECRT